MEDKFENHYEKISSQLAAIEFFTEPPQFEIYSPRLFSEDWLNNKLYDWEKYLSSMLDKINDCLKELEKIEEKELNHDLNDPFFSIEDLPSEILKFDSEKEKQEFELKLNFSSKYAPLLRESKKSLCDCFKFFKKNKNKPPYFEKFLMIDKIPFYGNQIEFALMVFLISQSNFVLVKKRKNQLDETISLIENRNEFENFLCKSQKDLVGLFCQYFKGVTIEKNKGIEQSFNPEAIYKKMNATALSGIKSSQFEEIEKRAEMILSQFLEIKNSKITEDQWNNRAT
jgi:hypothetical protein